MLKPENIKTIAIIGAGFMGPGIAQVFAVKGYRVNLEDIKPEDIKNVTLYKGAGCQRCRGKGYRGRVAVFELMELTPADGVCGTACSGVIARADFAAARCRGPNGLLPFIPVRSWCQLT